MFVKQMKKAHKSKIRFVLIFAALSALWQKKQRKAEQRELKGPCALLIQNEELLKNRKSELKINTFPNNSSLLGNSDIIIFAVKPQVLSSVCLELKEDVKSDHLFISIAYQVRKRYSWFRV